MREYNNSKIHISSNFPLSVSLIIMTEETQNSKKLHVLPLRNEQFI